MGGNMGKKNKGMKRKQLEHKELMEHNEKKYKHKMVHMILR